MQIKTHVVFREGECDLLTITPSAIRVDACNVTPRQLGGLMRACLLALNRIAEDKDREDQPQAQEALLAWDRFRPFHTAHVPTTLLTSSVGETNPQPDNN